MHANYKNYKNETLNDKLRMLLSFITVSANQILLEDGWDRDEVCDFIGDTSDYFKLITPDKSRSAFNITDFNIYENFGYRVAFASFAKLKENLRPYAVLFSNVLLYSLCDQHEYDQEKLTNFVHRMDPLLSKLIDNTINLHELREKQFKEFGFESKVNLKENKNGSSKQNIDKSEGSEA